MHTLHTPPDSIIRNTTRKGFLGTVWFETLNVHGPGFGYPGP